MKKVLGLILMALAISMVFVSCDDPIHEHSYSDEWKSDATNHWHECECGEKKDVAAHTFGEWNASSEKGKVERTCSVCKYSEKAEGTFVKTLDELSSALSKDKVIYLGADLTSSEVKLSKNLVLDLNGKTITLNSENSDAVSLEKADTAYTVVIRNGKIKGNAKNNIFTLRTNAGLTLDNVTMDVECLRGIQIYMYSQKVTVNINGSKLKVKGYYTVATNADIAKADNKEGAAVGTYSKDNTINIESSNLEVTYDKDDCTGLLLNVPGTYTITDSTIKGGRQAAILRGGTYIINGSTFEYTTNNDENKAMEGEGAVWKSGNAVPNATLVIGNRTNTAYEYPTTVTFKGSNTLIAPADSNQLYVYQADATESKKVTVNGADSSWKVNSDKNGATYNTK